MKTRETLRWLAVAIGMAVPAAAWSDAYPTKPITVVVPFAAGGPTDAVARLVGKAMEPSLKQPVIIDNTAGAGGTIAGAKVARAAPDGYTLFLHHIGHATSAPASTEPAPARAVARASTPGLHAKENLPLV